MRYLMAKQLLFDLSVLVCQLHPFCITAAAASAPLPSSATSTTGGMTGNHQQHLGGNSGGCSSPPSSPSPSRQNTRGGPLPPPSSGSTGNETSTRKGPSSTSPPARRRPLLTIRRKAVPTGSNRPTPSSPLAEVAGRVAELVEAVLSHPGSPPSPLPHSQTVGTAAAAVPHSDAAEASATAIAAPVIHRPAEEPRGTTLAGTTALGPLPPVQTPAPRSLSSRERVAGIGGGGAGLSLPLSGAARAVGSLVSLLAAIVGADVDRSRQQQQQHRTSPHSEALGGVEGNKTRRNTARLTATSSSSSSSSSLVGSRETTATAPTTTKTAVTSLSDGILRLASVVIRGANLAFLLDLDAMQVCLCVCSCVSCRKCLTGGACRLSCSGIFSGALLPNPVLFRSNTDFPTHPPEAPGLFFTADYSFFFVCFSYDPFRRTRNTF